MSARAKRGATIFARVSSIADIAEPLLGIDRLAGQLAHIRQMPHGWLFVTRDPTDTLNFPIDHPRSGQPRYDWHDGPDGIRRGYLRPETTSA